MVRASLFSGATTLAACLLLANAVAAEIVRVTLQRTTLEPAHNTTELHPGRPGRMIRQSIARERLEAYMKDIAYFGTVQVGNPPRSFRVDFDTGSANTWISSTLCSSIACLNHRRFDPSESTTFRNDGRRFLVQYGDGSSVNGQLGHDDMNIGGVTLRNQPFGLAQYESDDMDDSTIDGIMGLAFPALSAVPGVPTVLDTMVSQRLLDAPVFSFHLSRGGEDGQSTGEIIFGGIDSSRFHKPMRFATVTRPLYWQFHVDNVYLGDTSLHLSSDAVVDTGTSLIVVPNAIARQMHAHVPGSIYSRTSGWLIPCNLSGSGPDLVFEMAGGRSIVPSVDYVGPALTLTPEMCFSNIMNSDIEHWILGDTFLKNNYVMFDYGGRRIGFAHRTEDVRVRRVKNTTATATGTATGKSRARGQQRIMATSEDEFEPVAAQTDADNATSDSNVDAEPPSKQEDDAATESTDYPARSVSLPVEQPSANTE